MAKEKRTNKGIVSGVTVWLEGALALSQAFERLLVDVVAAFVPWLAPVIPAYLAFHSLYYVLIKDVLWVSIVGAVVVEFLGLATVTTVVQFGDFNASLTPNPSPEVRGEKAPFWPAALIAGFYLIVVLTVNVLLDNSEPIQKFAKLLLSTLSVAGAVTISLRGQHRRRVDLKILRDAKAGEERVRKEEEDRKYKQRVADERRKNTQELKVIMLKEKLSEKNNNLPKVSEEISENSEKKPANFGKYRNWRRVPEDERLNVFHMRNDVRLVMTEYGVSERTGYHWIENAEKEFIQKLEEGREVKSE